MTKAQFATEANRLGRAWGLTLAAEQLDAWYRRLQSVQPDTWAGAVDRLIADYLQPPRHGLLDAILRAADTAGEELRRSRHRAEARQADALLRGSALRPRCADSREEAYNEFRLRLMREMLREPMTHPQRAAWLSDRLQTWADDPANVAWAARVAMGDCGRCQGPHSVLSCMLAEAEYWHNVSKEIQVIVC